MKSKRKQKNKYFAGGKGFPTKKELLLYCKNILQSEFGELQGDSFKVIDDVFKMHPRYLIKKGSGSYKIFIDSCSTNPRNNAFYIKPSTGSIIDFSYYKAINGYSPETRAKETLRNVVRPQTTKFRKNYIKNNSIAGGYLVCETTNLKAKPKEIHMDHYPLQFEEIVAMWFEENNLTLSTFKLTPPKGFGTYWIIEDSDLEKSFYAFHEEKAQYRMVLNKVNLQRGKAKVKLPQ